MVKLDRLATRSIGKIRWELLPNKNQARIELHVLQTGSWVRKVKKKKSSNEPRSLNYFGKTEDGNRVSGRKIGVKSDMTI